MQLTTVTEYRNLVMQFAELRALRIRINVTGIMDTNDVEALANGVIASAMAEAEAAEQLSQRDIELLAQGLRYSIRLLEGGPEESHAEAMRRVRRVARELRAWYDSEEG